MGGVVWRRRRVRVRVRLSEGGRGEWCEGLEVVCQEDGIGEGVDERAL